MKNPIQMIKQCVEKEEPYFLLRGQDICALKAIEAYYEEVKGHVKNPYFIEEIERTNLSEISEDKLTLSNARFEKTVKKYIAVTWKDRLIEAAKPLRCRLIQHIRKHRG